MGSLKLVLAGGATMTMTTTTARLFPEVLGRSFPRGTYETLGPPPSISWISLRVSLGLTWTSVLFLLAHLDYDILFTSV